MTTFLDGPAQGQKLTLQRSPLFLRVVEFKGKWDALDLLDDTPAPGETIHVYRLASNPSSMHVDGRDPKTGKRFWRWMTVADYTYHPKQPTQAQASDNASWREWCEANRST